MDADKAIPGAGPKADREGQSDALVAMALQGREEQARAEIAALHAGGTSFEDLQLDLLAKAALKLGMLWEQDSLSFVDVTLATGTLHRLSQFVAVALSREQAAEARAATATRLSICILPEPGAAHTFGASMAAKFFEKEGWHVDYHPAPEKGALAQILRARHIDVLGVSLALREQAAAAARLLAELREASRNRDLLTVAGGTAIQRDPGLVPRLGVDAVMTDITIAPAATAELVMRRRQVE